MMMVEEKMEANKASASSHGAAFEAMNGDAGKETTKKEQQQETFSPQVLKAVYRLGTHTRFFFCIFFFFLEKNKTGSSSWWL